MKKSSLRYALLLALGLGVNQFAHALGLGPIQVNSYYGQPLSASIRLDGLSAGQAEKTIIRLAGHEAYQTRGIERLPSHEQLKFTLERAGKAYRIKVHSVNSISDPFLNFLITVNSGGSVVTREYSVFLDPDPSQALGGSKAPKALPMASEPVAVKQPKSTKAQPQQPVPVAQPAERSGAMPAGNYNPAALNGDTYGPVGAGDTLYSIANATRPDNVSVKAMMNAIKRANRHAFAGNSLKVGATLTIPSEVSGSPKSDAPAEPKRAQKTKKNSEKSASKKTKSTPVRKKERSDAEVTRPVVADAVPSTTETPSAPVELPPAPPPPPAEEKIVPEKVIVEEVKLPKAEPAKTETPPAEVKEEKPVVETPPPPEATLPPPVENKPVETPPPPEATLPPPVETPPTVEVTLPPPPPAETVSEPKPIELTSTLPVETPPPPPPVEKVTPPAEPVAMEEEGLPAWVPWAAGGAGVGLLGLLSYFLIAKRRAKSYKEEDIEEDLSDEDMAEMLRQFEAEQDDLDRRHDDGLEALQELGSKKYQREEDLGEVDFDDFNNDDFKREISLSKPSDNDEQDFNQMFGNNNNVDSDDIFIDEDDTPVTLNKKSPPPADDDFDLGEFSDDQFTEEALSVSQSNSKVVSDDDMDFFVDDEPTAKKAPEVAFDDMDFFAEEPAKPVAPPPPSKPIVEDSMEFFVEDTPAPAVKSAPSKPADDFGGLDMEFFTEEKAPVVETPKSVKHDNELDFGLDFGSEPVVEETPKVQSVPAENSIDFADFQMDEPKISVSDVVIKPVVEAVKEVKEDISNVLSFDDFTTESASPAPAPSSKAPSKADEEAMEINLDLADSFIATGNGERAKSWLSEVLELGTEAQKARARQMLDKINNG